MQYFYKNNYYLITLTLNTKRKYQYFIISAPLTYAKLPKFSHIQGNRSAIFIFMYNHKQQIKLTFQTKRQSNKNYKYLHMPLHKSNIMVLVDIWNKHMKLQTETKMKAMNFQTQILTLQFTHISAYIHTHTFKFIYTIINPCSIHTLHFTLQFFFLPAFVMANV